MAVGGTFLIPSLRSGLVAMVAVAASAFLLEAFVPFGRWTGIPPFTFPFVAATLFTIYALRLVSSPLLAAGFGRTPEEVRENALANRLRYRGEQRHTGPALCRQMVRLARQQRPLDPPGNLALCLRFRHRRRRRPNPSRRRRTTQRLLLLSHAGSLARDRPRGAHCQRHDR